MLTPPQQTQSQAAWCLCSRTTILMSKRMLNPDRCVCVKRFWPCKCYMVVFLSEPMTHNKVGGTNLICSAAAWPCRESTTEGVHMSFEPFQLSSSICLPVLRLWVKLTSNTDSSIGVTLAVSPDACVSLSLKIFSHVDTRVIQQNSLLEQGQCMRTVAASQFTPTLDKAWVFHDTMKCLPLGREGSICAAVDLTVSDLIRRGQFHHCYFFSWHLQSIYVHFVSKGTRC